MMQEAWELLEFWFSDEASPLWFNSNEHFDRKLRNKYETLWQRGASGELDYWKDQAEGALALVILLDQIPLNIFRGQVKSFSTEQQAVAITKHAVQNGYDQLLQSAEQAFLYMPLMHSENIQDQNNAIILFERAGLEDNLRFAKHHHDIVDRFGRFPHRNRILARESTAEELEWLQSEEAFLG